MRSETQEIIANQGEIMHIKKINVKHVWNIVLMFMYFFDVSVLFLPQVFSTRKIALAIFVLGTINKGIHILKDDFECIKLFAIANGMMFVYVLLVSYIQGGLDHENSIMPRYAYFLLYAVFGLVFLINRYRDEYELMEDIIPTMWIQTVIIFFEFFSIKFKMFLTDTFTSTGNVSYMRTDRATGLGAEAGYLTLLLFVGVFCCCYIMMTKGVKIKYVISSAVFIAAMFPVGRTGLYAALVLLLVTMGLFCIQKGHLKHLLKLLGGSLTLLMIALIVMKKYMTERQFDRFFNRFISALENFLEDPSVQSLQADIVPRLSFNTLVGTGIYRGEIGSVYAYADGGYVQMYVAMGLCISCIFYVILFSTYYYMLKKINVPIVSINKLYISMLIVVLLVAEVKEPFVFKYIIPMFIFAVICLYHKRKVYEEKNASKKNQCYCSSL